MLALKGNHPLLHKEIEEFFKQAQNKNYQQEYNINTYQNYDKGHGRIERRTYCITSDIRWMDAKKEWKKLTSISMVKYHSEQNGQKNVRKDISYAVLMIMPKNLPIQKKH